MFRGPPGVAVPTVLPGLSVPSIHSPAFGLFSYFLEDSVARTQGQTSATLRECRKSLFIDRFLGFSPKPREIYP